MLKSFGVSVVVRQVKKHGRSQHGGRDSQFPPQFQRERTQVLCRVSVRDNTNNKKCDSDFRWCVRFFRHGG